MNQKSGDTARKPLMSKRVNRLLTVRTLIEALRAGKLAEYEIIEHGEKVARALGDARFDALLQDLVDRTEAQREGVRPLMPAPYVTQASALHQLRDLEDRLNETVSRSREHLAGNARKLARLLALSITETRLLDYLVRLEMDSDLQAAAHEIDRRSHLHFTLTLSRILNDRRDRVCAALRPTSRLLQSGIVEIHGQDPMSSGHGGGVTLGNLSVLPGLADGLLSSQFEFEGVFAPFFRKCGTGKLSLAQFLYLGDVVDVAKALLDGAVRTGSPGVQILLYGPPGTGKTELAHALAQEIGKPLYAIATGSTTGAPYGREERYRCFRLAQQALRSRKDALVLFDEVEDVMSDPSLYKLVPQVQKGWTNEMLETSPVPSIWIANSTGGIDTAYLRRFSLIIHVDCPPRSVRRGICETYFRDLPLEERVLSRLADAEDLTPADLHRARRVMDLSTELCSEPAKASRAVTALLGSGPRGPGQSVLLPKADFSLPDFDPALINTDIDLERLLEGLARSGEGRLCLYGAPGTGKTAFVRHVAERLDRELIVVSASSWLAPFVGMTEQKIRDSFERAARADAVLFVDEADSFLRDRSLARQSWEATQVNELLKRLEESRGIVAFATNDFDVLDPAVLRRLDIKAAFRPLSREQARTMFERTLAVNDTPVPAGTLQEAFARLQALDGVVNGDFAAACRHVHVAGKTLTPASLVSALEQEVHVRTRHQHSSIGFAASLT